MTFSSLFRVMADFKTDCKFAARQFCRSWSVTLVAILSIALGICAATTIFSAVQALVLNPYPYRDAGRIVQMQFWNKKGPRGFIGIPSSYLESLEGASGVESAFLESSANRTFKGSRYTRSIREISLSSNAFSFLGVDPLLGRCFSRLDLAKQGDPYVVVLNYAFWQRVLGGDPRVIGTGISIDNRLYTVVGVMPKRFDWDYGDIYVPIIPSGDPNDLHSVYFRLRPNVSYAAAAAQIFPLMQQLLRATEHISFPPGTYLKTVGFTQSRLGALRSRVLILFAAVLLLLLISCANVSILLLARGAARREEIAMRCALGATRIRIVRQLFTESVLLAVTGGVLGSIMAFVAVHTARVWLPAGMVPHETAIKINIWVLLFALILSVISGIIFGVIPGIQASRMGPEQVSDVPRARTTPSVRSRRYYSILIGGQAALTLLLIVAAGTALHAFLFLLHERLGIDPNRVLYFSVHLPAEHYQTWSERQEVFRNIQSELRRLPGVQSVSVSNVLPPYGGFQGEFAVGNHAHGEFPDRTDLEFVDGSYFSSLKISLLRGVGFSKDDIAHPSHVALISQSFARSHFGDRNPIGSTLYIPSLKFGYDGVSRPENPSPVVQIIGVVSDTRTFGVGTPLRSTVYLPQSLVLSGESWVIMRTKTNPSSVLDVTRLTMRRFHPDIPISDPKTLNSLLEDHAWSRARLTMSLLAIFSCIALIIAATGTYSTSSHSVAQRSQELGVRLALGATRSSILWDVLLSQVLLAFWGILGGCLLSTLGLNIVQLKEVSSSFSFFIMILACLTILVVAILASAAPATRAATLDPAAAIRQQ